MTPASPASKPARTELEELVHSLRNVVMAMQYGLSSLESARAAADDQQFTTAHAALAKQVQLLKDLVGRADRIAAAQESSAAPR